MRQTEVSRFERVTLCLNSCFYHQKFPKWRRKQMRKKREAKDEKEEGKKKRVEVMKAAAQAWLNHSQNSESTVLEFQAPRKKAFVRGKPSRFKTEEALLSTTTRKKHRNPSFLDWEYGQSLWDPYEILSVSKKLEQALTFEEYTFSLRILPSRRRTGTTLSNL